jgi:hypothetical protein
MKNVLKSTVLGLALLAGAAATAQAQSVSSLPPTSPPAASTTPATTPPAASTAKILPSPGDNSAWKEPHYQSTEADKDPARHPYTAPKFGPAPN